MAASQAQVACGYVERVTMLPRQLAHPRTRIRVDQRTVAHRPRHGDLGHPGQPGKVGHGQPSARDRLRAGFRRLRSEEHTSELHSLMRTSYAVFCFKKKT